MPPTSSLLTLLSHCNMMLFSLIYYPVMVRIDQNFFVHHVLHPELSLVVRLKPEGAQALCHHHPGDEDLSPRARTVNHPGFDGVVEDFGHHHSGPIGHALGDVAQGNDGGPHLEPDDVWRQATLLDAGEILLRVCVVPLVSTIGDAIDGREQMVFFTVDEGVQQVAVSVGVP